MTTLHLAVQGSTLTRVLLLGFLLSMIIAPLYTTLAYRGQWWKKPRTQAMGGASAAVYQKLHAAKHQRHIPTMAGMIFVLSIALVTLLGNLERGQTWLPLAGMVGAGLAGGLLVSSFTAGLIVFLIGGY